MSQPLGPQSGPQPRVKFCPNCKGVLRSVASRNQASEQSHSYRCDVRDWVYEINELRRETR